MKIGVISDTHLYTYSVEVKEIVDTHFGDVDMVIHAGDILEMEVLDAFLTKKIEGIIRAMLSVMVTQPPEGIGCQRTLQD